jgi:hypothetical protein
LLTSTFGGRVGQVYPDVNREDLFRVIERCAATNALREPVFELRQFRA